MRDFLQTPHFIILASALIIAAIWQYNRKRKPQYELLIAEDVQDNMSRQSVYLSKRIAGIERVLPSEREARIKTIEVQLKHFKKVFGKVDGFRHEWDDLTRYLQEQKNVFSVAQLQQR